MRARVPTCARAHHPTLREPAYLAHAPCVAQCSFAQVMKLAPLGFWAAAAHTGAVYAMSAGAVSFGQIVKAAEPAFAVVVGYTVYGKLESKAKIAMLIPIIGGIMIASAQELIPHPHPNPHPHPDPNPKSPSPSPSP